MKNKKFIVSNWKMNGTRALMRECLPIWQDNIPKGYEWIFCPPELYVSYLQEHFSTIITGAQDCSAQSSGAYTGQVSAAQLAECNARYIIVGHSECRQYRGDTNAIVRQKAMQVIQNGMTPIICIGESHEHYVKQETLAFLKVQIDECLADLQGDYILAYEPLWAIGTGITATPDDIFAVHQFLHTQCPKIPLLYGGSVNEDNAQRIMGVPHVNGLLVGGVSLKREEFNQLLNSLR